MHRLIQSIAAQGAMVLLCSTEADELASLCERVLIFYRGGSPVSWRLLASMPARYWRPSILVG
jgi:ABC-type sugar transport system ATPase subunit